MKYLLSVVSFLLLSVAVSYNVNQLLSFSGPFNSYDYEGNRVVSSWKNSGDAVINESFIRLTPDRQSKSGALWSQSTFNNGEWVTTIKFRISGQGASLYGDGFAVFFTQMSNAIQGKMFGIRDTFYGFAIAFSTFKNTEFSRYHRDISIYVGDGENGAFIQDQDRTGCYARYRFHEKRQDFSVDNYAVVKIGYSASTGKVTVSIDEKNSGNFHTCFTENINLKPDWWRRAYIGISATTGQLADNHDILSVETVEGESDPEKVLVSESKEVQDLKNHESHMFAELMTKYSVNVNGLDQKEHSLLKLIEESDKSQHLALNKLKRETEHKIVGIIAVDESLNNMIKKLNERGDVSEGRITEIEDSLKKDVQSTVSQKMEQRVKVLEDGFNKKMKDAVKKSSFAWMVPFVIVIVVIGVIILVVYNQYRTAQKTHLL